MTALSQDETNVRESMKRKHAGDNREDPKHVKSTSFDTNNTNIHLDSNVDESSELFDEYCQILLKDTGNHSQVHVSGSFLAEKDIFEEVPRTPLGVKLKSWAVKHSDILKHQVIDELLSILRDEGYLDLPSTTQALLTLVDNAKNSNCQDSLDKVDIWIKKEDSCESIWAPDDLENNSSETLSQSKIEQSSIACPDFAVTDFMDDDKSKSSCCSEKQNGMLMTGTEVQNSKVYAMMKEELRMMEERWARQLESTKRSLLYDMVRKYEDLKNKIGISTRPLGTGFTDDREILGAKLPFSEVETFCEFDESVRDNPEKEIAMKSLMTTLCFGASSLSNSIGCILSAFLTKDVQMQYSACGKKIRGVKKRNFGDTNTFKYAKDVLREKHGTSDAEIVSKTSRWFTGASDRDGGRKERKKDEKIIKT